MLDRTMHYIVNGVTVSDDTADAWERFMLYKDAQERADREQARAIREYHRRLTEQKCIGCSLILTGIASLAMSTIVVECLAVSLLNLLLGTYVATTTKIITA